MLATFTSAHSLGTVQLNWIDRIVDGNSIPYWDGAGVQVEYWKYGSKIVETISYGQRQITADRGEVIFKPISGKAAAFQYFSGRGINGTMMDAQGRYLGEVAATIEDYSTSSVVDIYWAAKPDPSFWAKLPGKANEIGGANDRIVCIGTTILGPFGYNINTLNGNTWTQTTESATQADIDQSGNLWVVNSIGNIWKQANGYWSQLPGSGTVVKIGKNGSVFMIGSNPVSGGYGIFKLDGNNWSSLPGGAVRLDVDPAGNPWVVNSFGEIYQWNSTWIKMPGSARDIGIDDAGNVYVIGTGSTDGGYQIFRWNTAAQSWNKYNFSGGIKVTGTKNGLLVINDRNEIFSHNN